MSERSSYYVSVQLTRLNGVLSAVKCCGWSSLTCLQRRQAIFTWELEFRLQLSFVGWNAAVLPCFQSYRYASVVSSFIICTIKNTTLSLKKEKEEKKKKRVPQSLSFCLSHSLVEENSCREIRTSFVYGLLHVLTNKTELPHAVLSADFILFNHVSRISSDFNTVFIFSFCIS